MCIHIHLYTHGYARCESVRIGLAAEMQRLSLSAYY